MAELQSNIILGVKPPEPIEAQSPLEIATAQEKLTTLRETARAKVEAAKDQAAMQKALASHQNPDGSPDFDAAVNDLYRTRPNAAVALAKHVQDAREAAAKQQGEELGNVTKAADAASQLLNGANVTDQASLDTLKLNLSKLHPAIAATVGQALNAPYDPVDTPKRLEQLSQIGLKAKEAADLKAQGYKLYLSGDKPRSLASFFAGSPNQAAWQQTIADAKAHGFTDAELAPYGPAWSQQAQDAAKMAALTPEQQVRYEETKTTNARLEASATEQARHNRAMEARPVANGASPDDAKAIADAIVSGSQPPDFTSMYRMVGPVRAELARQGYDLTRAEEDWKATTKYLSTLNGVQQVRLGQAVQFATSSLDLVDSLAKEWKGSVFKPLNAANLALAKQGAFGQKEKSIAVRLSAQIADLQSELGTVYKGGNSSTDESLKLASENLKGDWDEKTILDATKQIRTNLRIRQNSMTLAHVPGTRENNAYAPPGSGGGDAAKKHQVGDIVVGPDGQQHKIILVSPDGTKVQLGPVIK